MLLGGVPRAERTRMRAPLQTGQFPFPVKYGYAAVGRALADQSAEPAFKAIATPHARLHQVIQQVIELKNQHKHEAAEALYREIEQNSGQVVGYIDQLLQEMTKPAR